MGTSGITGGVAALRRAVRAAFTGRDAAESISHAPTPLVWTRLVSAPGRPGGEVRRVAQLTPYVVETIVEDALRGGRGARLELTVVSRVGEAGLAHLRDQFSRSEERRVGKESRAPRSRASSRRKRSACARNPSSGKKQRRSSRQTVT